MATEMDPVLEGLTEDQASSLQADLAGLIGHVNPRIWYAETRRSSFATIAAGLLAAGFALLTALLINHARYRPGLWALVVVGLGSILTGAVVLIVYARQTNFDYPFKQHTSTWKWFYRDAIPLAKEIKTPWHTIQWAADREQATQIFDSEYRDFVKRQATLLDPKINLAQDLQQLYVLHVNEFYKNRFLTEVRRVLTFGICVTAIAATLTFVATSITRGSQHRHSSVPSPTVTKS